MTDRDDRNARSRLLDAAVELFTERGFAATSVREIVEKAGVTKPVLYYHFGSKERIYREILEDTRRALEETLARLQKTEGGARDRLERLFVGLYEWFEENRSWVRFLNAASWGPPQGAPALDLDAFDRRVLDGIRAIVKAGVDAGELRKADPDDITFALIGVLVFSMDVQLAHPDWGRGKASLVRLLDLVFQGVETPAIPRRRPRAETSEAPRALPRSPRRPRP